jgi:hypothetical protein
VTKKKASEGLDSGKQKLEVINKKVSEKQKLEVINKNVFATGQANRQLEGLTGVGKGHEEEPRAKQPRFGPDRAPGPCDSGRPFCSSVAEGLLDKITQEHREQKAVKSDDADVPEYLWETHLLEDVQGVDWNEDSLRRVRKVTEWLREHMLRWWK